MPECPRCHQSVDAQAIVCPHCRTTLKAHGHPGIPLYRATGIEPLCKTCIYDADDSCTYPKRPDARECTLYSDRLPVSVSPLNKSSSRFLTKGWFRQNSVWLVLVGLVILSLWLALR
ncbi:zinc ribbon domain-containing protein [Phormidesmis priestleyi ULC007]|uniref:Zinc ribbon domain-containing protein n=1 Tax=Phormidesmis priestleyi ULC007 TaxID=1920490 RepID=A0A2T1D7G7_9CYAN|nr:zinc ribbon domain-containing protein [Phormidesmis priestleyi]PSB16419.1 zinc ribbon domain-containing protein [Phormidesmis priestleyi ULC007]PZO47347.1 MAG: zinc ribbon domain-containing protein [Phormidesmis priestleyi]